MIDMLLIPNVGSGFVLKYDEAEYLRRVNKKNQYAAALKEKMLKIQIQDAGRVHYHYPPNPKLTIKADTRQRVLGRDYTIMDFTELTEIMHHRLLKSTL